MQSGTFSMASGRPIDSIRFETINGKQIKYQSVQADGLAMPVQSIVKINQDPHPEYFEALDKLVPFAIKVMDLGKHWEPISSISSLKLDWTYSDTKDKWFYKIAEITIARCSDISEVCIDRHIKFGGIIIDDIPWGVRDVIEAIMDEAWLYCSGKKTAQLNLFDQGKAELIDRIMAKDVPEEVMDAAIETIIDRKAVKASLQSMGVQNYVIEDYLETAGDSPSVEGFHEWQCEPEQQCLIRSAEALIESRKEQKEEPIAPQRKTRSKAKKEVIPA